MSLERTALRLGVVMALSNGYAAPWPTIAEARVFDSRIDPIEGLGKGDLAPMAVVYTDDDEGEQLSDNNGGPPFRHMVKLCIELVIGMGGEANEDGTVPAVMVQTEPELEAMLDLFETQVDRIFRHPVTPWATRLFEHLIVRVESWKSTRYVEREGQARIAARQIVATVMLPQPPEPEIVATAPTGTQPIPAPLGPLLQAIVDGDGPYAPSASALSDLLTAHGGFQPLVLPPLSRVRLIEAAQAETNDDDVQRGPRPDGVAQVNLPSP